MTDYPYLKAALQAQTRYGQGDLDAYFADVRCATPTALRDGEMRIHILRSMKRGGPRVRGLAKFMMGAIIDYCIPRAKIEAAAKAYQESGSTRGFANLDSQARELFARVERSGEGGELLLFLLTEAVLGYPQVLCKMNLKTSRNVHFHGADGVYASVDAATQTFRIHWGESKLYRGLNAAIDACMESLSGILEEEGHLGGSERDLLLVTDFGELPEGELEDAFVRFLDPDAPEYLSTEFCGVALVGYNASNFPKVVDEDVVQLEELGLAADIDEWRRRIEQRRTENGIDGFRLDLFILPLPDVDDLRSQFLSMVKGGGL